MDKTIYNDWQPSPGLNQPYWLVYLAYNGLHTLLMTGRPGLGKSTLLARLSCT